MRCMGLDIGDKRIGVALSDPGGVLASPFTVITRGSEMADISTLVDIVNQNQIQQVIVGLPRNMDGSLGQQAEKVAAFAQKLIRYIRVPVEFRDERLTTVQAKKLRQMAKVKKTRGKVSDDDAAAALILQGYLDEERKEG